MITRLKLKNFKSIDEQVYDFTHFDLLVGRNNCGKSTVLQSLAIWQFCVDEFHRAKRSGSKGIQVVLPNFTALPVPEFNLLWKNRTDRAYPVIDGKRRQEFILIEIHVEWRHGGNEVRSFGVELRYHSPQTIYAIPVEGWTKFRDYEKEGNLPKIAYVPPFSGLEPVEKRLDISPIRQQIGKGQPGSILRNLLLQVCPSPIRDENGGVSKDHSHPPENWKELATTIERWFSVTIREPKYESEKDVYITVEYRQNGENYDIIAGGSGFHQTLTLMAFLYGYRPTTILLDEPDAHLHVNLQREILDYFKLKSNELGVQFLIASHSEEFVRGVDPSQIVSLLAQKPTRIQSTPEVLRAMSDVTNEEITLLMASPYILYVEGESDERILRAWAEQCDAKNAIDRIYFKSMGGGGKKNMRERSDNHFKALKQIIPQVSKLMLFDYDSSEDAFHPEENNLGLAEWKRKNIENYLLVPEAWIRSAIKELDFSENDIFAIGIKQSINDFFSSENLTLPPGKNWRNVTANVFKVVDGKRILFENDNSLFQILRKNDPSVQLIREKVAMNMNVDEIHEDVHVFIGKIVKLTKQIE